jgi:DNA primase
MARFVGNDVKERIRDALDIVEVIGSYVTLKRIGGGKAMGLCPFHKEKTPSFHVNADRQSFHCFGCGAGGDVFSFVQQYENVDFPEALRLMASRAGIALEYEEGGSGGERGGPSKEDLYAANEEACKRYQAELRESPEAAEARAYLLGRKLGEEVWAEWGIGYAPDQWGFLRDSAGPAGGARMKVLEAAGLLKTNEKGTVYDVFRGRIMFTLRDERGRAVGFSGRRMEAGGEGGKYVNTAETGVFRKGRMLFGLDRAKERIASTGMAILCEGQIDCIRCHLAGLGNVVGAQGTAFGQEQARLLKRYAKEAKIVLDGDEAGTTAAMKMTSFLLPEEIAVSLVPLPAGEDPDSLILKEGPEAFASRLEKARTPMGFLLDTLRAKVDLSSDRGMIHATREAIGLAKRAAGAVQAERMLREAAEGLGVSYGALEADWERATSRKSREVAPTPAPAAVEGRGPPRERPLEEVELATLLCHNGTPELLGFVRDWLPYPLIRDADCRAVVHALLEEEGSLLGALADESEECRAFAARIANSPQKVVGDEMAEDGQRAAQDILLRLWRRHLVGRREEINRGLKGLEGEARRERTQEFAQLMLDVGRLNAGWESGSKVIAHHLDELA